MPQGQVHHLPPDELPPPPLPPLGGASAATPAAAAGAGGAAFKHATAIARLQLSASGGHEALKAADSAPAATAEQRNGAGQGHGYSPHGLIVREGARDRELSSGEGGHALRQGPEASAHSWDAGPGSLPLPSQSPLREHDEEDTRCVSSAADPGSRRSSKPRGSRRSAREVKRLGETIYKGHRSYDLMLSLQLGIRYTVGRRAQAAPQPLVPADFERRADAKLTFPRQGTSRTPPHEAPSFVWKEYAPAVFRHLQEISCVDPSDYMLSICGDGALRELSSPGKSGSIFYVSHDDRFIIKTMRKAEVKVLLAMLAAYLTHLRLHESTLLTRFFGLHQIKAHGGRRVRFVVTGHLFAPELPVDRRYDLKGSSQGRSANKFEIDETTTLKDLDLEHAFVLHDSWREPLLSQIEHDCRFLEEQQIMDYSLLLGVHDMATKQHCQPSPFSINPSATHATALEQFSSADNTTSTLVVGSRQANGELPQSDTTPHGPSFTDKAEGLSQREDMFRQQAGSASQARSPLRGTERCYGSPQLSGWGLYRETQLGQNMRATAVRLDSWSGLPVANLGQADAKEVVLCMGIIDILQRYNVSKKVEHALKSLQYNANSISAVDPLLYARRFQHFVAITFPDPAATTCVGLPGPEHPLSAGKPATSACSQHLQTV
eukprot:SM000358S13182  [mRNA]  locus=s358:6526:10380:- [translate_table: standard]